MVVLEITGFFDGVVLEITGFLMRGAAAIGKRSDGLKERELGAFDWNLPHQR